MPLLSRMPRITSDNRRWWVLATMTGSLSMIMIDQTVVGVALPSMQRGLGLSATGVQWVVNSYLLVLAVLVALGGRLGDMLGQERMFRIGVATFVAASAAVGLAQSELWVIVARGLQGVGAALMLPATGAIVVNAFDPGERGKAMGIYAGTSMVFLALGPLVGGLLTQLVSWRAAFYINLPIGLVTLIAAHYTLQTSSRPAGERAESADPVGAALLVGGLGSLVLAMMQAEQWGWGSPAVLGLLAAAAVIAPMFVAWELRQEQPLIRLQLFRSGNFAIDNIVLLAVQFALIGVSVFGAIWVQDVLGFGPITAGLSLLPLTLVLLPTAPIAGKLNDQHGPRALLGTGTILLSLALAWLAIVLPKQSYAWVIPAYVAIGVALGLTISAASTDALNAAEPAERGEASGITQMMRQVGGAIGLAVLGTVISGNMHAAAPTHHAINAALTSATADAFWVGAAVLLPVGLAAIALLRHHAATDAVVEPTSPALEAITA